jgi:ribonucleoside-triphosphate reductase
MEDQKGFALTFSYDEGFVAFMQRLRRLYPDQALWNLEGIGDQLDLNKFAKGFFKNKEATSDISVDANANVDSKDVIAYSFEAYKAITRLNNYYLFWKKHTELYGQADAEALLEEQFMGTLYINDFSGDFGKPYCFNYSTFDIALEGLPMIDKIVSKPPKYLYSFKSQLEQFVVNASNATLGATGFADLFIVMAHYVDKALEEKKDGHFCFKTTEDVWQYVKETLASLIYTINWPMRGNQSPFTNVSVMDEYFLRDLLPSYVFPDGSVPRLDTVLTLQVVFLATMNEELCRTPLTFPVTTACFAVNDEGEILDDVFVQHIAHYNMQFGFINIYTGKTSTLSSCCRLRSDTSTEYFNSFGAGSTKIGSMGVVTLNLPRIAEDNHRDFALFLGELKLYVGRVGRINSTKRAFIQDRINEGAMPLYSLGFMDLKKQYSTCGVNGLYEALVKLGFDILTPEGEEAALKIVKVINEANESLTGLYEFPHNCEQTPSETSAIKLATKDKLLEKNPEEYPLYSNQFVPLTHDAVLMDRIRIQGILDKHFSGGAICHVTTGERLTSELVMRALIYHCAKMGVVYWAVNYTLNKCENGHMTVGSGVPVCPICGKPITDTFTRVVGFLTNTKNWHKVRREEDFPKRINHTF